SSGESHTARRTDRGAKERKMSADGTWNVSMQTLIGERKLTVALKLSGSVLTGKVTGEDGKSTDIFDGTANGDNISFKAAITNPMPLTLEVSGVIAGHKISGTVNARGVGSMPFTGSRA